MKHTFRKSRTLARTCLLLLGLGELSVHAATITWTNLSGGSFGTAANWSPNAVPGGGDVAVITNAGTYTVTLDGGRTVGGLLLGLPAGPNGQTLNLNGSVLTLSGTVTVNTNATLILAPGASNLDWPSVVFTNLGTVIWNAGNIRGSTATQIYNYGLWQADSDNEYNNAFGGCCPGVFNNLGIFRKAAGTGTTSIGSLAGGVLFNNTGLVDVRSGTVNLGTGGVNSAPGVFNTSNTAAVVFGASYTFNNGSQFTGTGDVRLEAGTFTMTGNITFTKLTQVGGALAGTATLNGVYDWVGGTWNPGPKTLASGSTLNITNAANHNWPDVVFTNFGTVVWRAGSIQGNSSTHIYNHGLWLAESDNEYNNAFGGCCPGVFNNLGIFRKAAGTGTTSIGSLAGGVLFNNTGLVDVRSGTVNLGTGGVNSAPGVFNTSNTAAVVFGASYTFNNGSQFTGTGDVRLEAGTFTMTGNITFTKLTQVGGALAGTATLNGVYDWVGGTWNPGPKTLASGSTLNITNAANHNWPDVVFTNFGTVVWRAGNIQGNSSTHIYNHGLWLAESDNEYNNAFGGCCPGVFNNLGVFRKASGTGTTAIGSPSGGVIFNNTGLLDVQTGTVNLATAYNLTGGSINIGISSLSNFGKVGLAGASAFTGNFSANLIGGYIPITNNSFPVITYGSLSGVFTNYSLPFADAWTNIYSPTTFSLYVLNARPIPPVFTTNHVVNELTTLLVTNTAVDLDVPTNTLTYMLLAPPAGAAISSAGIFTWTPSEAQGPVTNVITSVVTDNGVPALSATNSFTVVVQEINVPPALSPLANTNVNELTTLTLTNSATDSDLPANTLTYLLLASPAGAVIDTNGVITWTPTEVQGPGTNTFITVVTDYNPDAINEQQLTVTNTFEVVVNEVNVPPVLFVPANTNIIELTNYSALATATDADVPANALSFELVSGPAGLTVSPGGLITWTPAERQGPSTNPVTLRVTDLNAFAINATSLSDTNSFTIIVTEVNAPPLLPAQTNVAVLELTTLTITNAATDSDIPTNALAYVLLNAPAGAAIDTNGVITWTPTEAQGPGTNTITTVVTDLNPDASNLQQFSVTNSFEVVVQEVNAVPMLTLPPNTNINELVIFIAQATATDSDDPTNALTFALVSGPAGLTVSPAGLIIWTPTEEQGPGTNTVLIRVSDNGTTSLSTTNSFTLVVREVNGSPSFASDSIPDSPLIDELVPYNFILSANDSDVPANPLTYELVSGPAGITVAPAGQLNWTPTEAQGNNQSYTVQIRVSDYSPSAINALSITQSIGFLIRVREVNVPPTLDTLTNHTVNPGQTVNFTATAIDSDLPTNTLTFSLLGAPAGATIDATSGAFNWRPGVALTDTTNTIQVRVQDNGAPALNDVKSFSVIIQPLTAPVVLTPLSYNSGVFTLSATGSLGPDYVLMVSTNLQQWTDLKTNLAPALPTPFTDPDAGVIPARVYRVRLQP